MGQYTTPAVLIPEDFDGKPFSHELDWRWIVGAAPHDYYKSTLKFSGMIG
jgi:hypothetical protein